MQRVTTLHVTGELCLRSGVCRQRGRGTLHDSRVYCKTECVSQETGHRAAGKCEGNPTCVHSCSSNRTQSGSLYRVCSRRRRYRPMTSSSSWRRPRSALICGSLSKGTERGNSVSSLSLSEILRRLFLIAELLVVFASALIAFRKGSLKIDARILSLQIFDLRSHFCRYLIELLAAGAGMESGFKPHPIEFLVLLERTA